MNIQQYTQHKCFWLGSLICGFLVGGCGSDDDPSLVLLEASRVVSGNVSKGPLNGATIRVYEIDAHGIRQGSFLAETATDAGGNWALSVPVDVDNLVIESSGGVYVDEADSEPDPNLRRSIQLAADDSFSAVLPATAGSVAINVYTDALLRKSRYETQGANFFEVYELNRSFMNAAFGFDITTTQPADPIAPDTAASLQSRSYAMALGGAANAVNALSIANDFVVGSYPVIAAMMDDLTDCVIDGHGVAGPVQGVTTLILDLNSEILRFRNNNFNAYQGTPLLQIDQSECARSGQLPDRIAPEFFGLPGDFAVGTSDEQGIASSAPTVQENLQDIQAVDDRDGAVSVVSDISDILPIGENLVTFTASDLTGNTRTVELTITVILLTVQELQPGPPAEREIPPIFQPIRDAAGRSAAAELDSDLDTLPDAIEIALGTDPHDSDTDRDGVPDAMEIKFDSDPLVASAVVHVPVTVSPADYHFSFAGTDADRPAFIIYEPGLHNGRVWLAPPCDHIVLIGNMGGSNDPATQALVIGETPLTMVGCRKVQLYSMNFRDTDLDFINMRQIDSQ